MAKKSKIAKYKRQLKLIETYADKRAQLKAEGNITALAKLPKGSRPTYLRRRDQLDGRPRGVMRKFGLSRINFRTLAHQGKLPGVRKASW